MVKIRARVVVWIRVRIIVRTRARVMARVRFQVMVLTLINHFSGYFIQDSLYAGFQMFAFCKETILAN